MKTLNFQEFSFIKPCAVILQSVFRIRHLLTFLLIYQIKVMDPSADKIIALKHILNQRNSQDMRT